MGTKATKKATEALISHGLCEPCTHSLLAQLGMPLADYLAGLDAPVVTINAQGQISGGNAEALALVEKPPTALHNEKECKVFECVHARLSGGCGQTICRSGCVIRRTVMDTLATGKPHSEIPAVHKKHPDTDPRYYDLLISTEKKEGVVFLRIDAIKERRGTQSTTGNGSEYGGVQWMALCLCKCT